MENKTWCSVWHVGRKHGGSVAGAQRPRLNEKVDCPEKAFLFLSANQGSGPGAVGLSFCHRMRDADGLFKAVCTEKKKDLFDCFLVD
jgi:hypothetical protein